MNKERYSDPTADRAIANVCKEEKRKKIHSNWSKYKAGRTNMEKKMEQLINKNKSADESEQQHVL